MYAMGARPNFVKMAPVVAQLRRRLPGATHIVVHTGQHYDPEMSSRFFEQLGLPPADFSLHVGSGTDAEQIARGLERIGPVIEGERPDLVIVAGDVNSTAAVARATAQAGVALAHVESGLRSFDQTMPEEGNRILADSLSEYLFIHSPEARDNLLAEGIADRRIHFVGNTMIDSLVRVESRFRQLDFPRQVGVSPGQYLLVTLHRPPVVDGPLLGAVLRELGAVAGELPVVFPTHPRTRKAMAGMRIPAGVNVLDPLGYLEFLSLEATAAAVLTDSGGVQEEATFLGVPCFTLRKNTERPITVTHGTNTVLGLAPERIAEIFPSIAERRSGARAPLPGWDGRAAERIAGIICGDSDAAIDAELQHPASSIRG
jgi:UDP-N-acetylglucosamine 2-epimerase (non-hydrolysing)